MVVRSNEDVVVVEHETSGVTRFERGEGVRVERVRWVWKRMRIKIGACDIQGGCNRAET